MANQKKVSSPSIEGAALRELVGRAIRQLALQNNMTLESYASSQGLEKFHLTPFLATQHVGANLRIQSKDMVSRILPVLESSHFAANGGTLGLTRQGHDILLGLLDEQPDEQRAAVISVPEPTAKKPKTVVVRQGMPLEILNDVMFLGANPEVKARMLRLSEYLEGHGQKLTTLLRQASE